MDHNFNPYEHKPTNTMETAAMVLGTGSIVLSTCIYVSIPFGALAIIFALLSRGARMSLSARARNALILGIAGLVITFILCIYAFYTIMQDPGQFEDMLRQYCEMAGYDYDTLFGPYFK